ncbi:MAG: hypothetical protein KDH96_02600, partial [Candidatus Riesia sp.]|nr:hypothetical protein [Candidatus Riesia sp.]
MSFIPKILSTNNSQQKKQIYFQQLAQQKWVISKQIIGNVKITITDQSGIELKERKNNIGDYDVVYNGNLIEIHFNIPVAGKCELLLYENTISNIINKSLDSFKSSDLFLLLPHNKDIIPIQYTTLSSTIYTGNIYKII